MKRLSSAAVVCTFLREEKLGDRACYVVQSMPKAASITYNLGLNDEDFSERRMRRPPQEWTK